MFPFFVFGKAFAPFKNKNEDFQQRQRWGLMLLLLPFPLSKMFFGEAVGVESREWEC